MGILEKIKEIEAEMARTQKNKVTTSCPWRLGAGVCARRVDPSRPVGQPCPCATHFFPGILNLAHAALLPFALTQATEYHLGQLKARLAKLRTELQAPSSKVGCSCTRPWSAAYCT